MKIPPLLRRWIVLGFLALWLTACSPAAGLSPAMPTPVLTRATATAGSPTGTPLPSPSPAPAATATRVVTAPTDTPRLDTATATASAPRLTDEQVLAQAVLHTDDPAYCSWQILGQAKSVLYAWAYCKTVGAANGPKGSSPVIIHLDEQGRYSTVDAPLDETQSTEIVKQFPADAQEAVAKLAVANSGNQNGMLINQKALEWGVQMRGVAFDAPYILPVFSGDYCKDGPSKIGQDLPPAPGKEYSGWKQYTQPEDGFSFNLPADWSVEEGWFSCVQRPPAPHFLFLHSPADLYRLAVAFRKPDEAEYLTRTGTPAGDFFDAGTLTFLGEKVKIRRLIYGTRTMAVFYNSSAEFPAGGLLFNLSLDISSDPQDNASISPEIEAQAAKILTSFKRVP